MENQEIVKVCFTIGFDANNKNIVKKIKFDENDNSPWFEFDGAHSKLDNHDLIKERVIELQQKNSYKRDWTLHWFLPKYDQSTYLKNSKFFFKTKYLKEGKKIS